MSVNKKANPVNKKPIDSNTSEKKDPVPAYNSYNISLEELPPELRPKPKTEFNFPLELVKGIIRSNLEYDKNLAEVKDILKKPTRTKEDLDKIREDFARIKEIRKEEMLFKASHTTLEEIQEMRTSDDVFAVVNYGKKELAIAAVQHLYDLCINENFMNAVGTLRHISKIGDKYDAYHATNLEVRNLAKELYQDLKNKHLAFDSREDELTYRTSCTTLEDIQKMRTGDDFHEVLYYGPKELALAAVQRLCNMSSAGDANAFCTLYLFSDEWQKQFSKPTGDPEARKVATEFYLEMKAKNNPALNRYADQIQKLSNQIQKVD